MCEEQTSQVCGPATLMDRRESICVALERVQDIVTVCGEACEARTSESTAVASTLRHGAARPLGLQLTVLSAIIVQLRNRKSSES
jgi:hypothetical protein